jgi:hypothetical protein
LGRDARGECCHLAGTVAWVFVIVAESAADAARVTEALFATPAVNPGVFRPNYCGCQ